MIHFNFFISHSTSSFVSSHLVSLYSQFLVLLNITNLQYPMASYDEQGGKPLPKFGEWDVNDPASAEGFTVIFNKARDEKKIASASGRFPSQRRYDSRTRGKDNKNNNTSTTKKKWFCFSL